MAADGLDKGSPGPHAWVSGSGCAGETEGVCLWNLQPLGGERPPCCWSQGSAFHGHTVRSISTKRPPGGGGLHLLLRGRGQGPGRPEEEQAVLFEVPISSHPPTPAPEQTARLPSLPPRWGLPPHGPQWTSGIREKEVRQGDVAHGTPSRLPTPYFPALLADWPAVRRAAGGAQGVPGR